MEAAPEYRVIVDANNLTVEIENELSEHPGGLFWAQFRAFGVQEVVLRGFGGQDLVLKGFGGAFRGRSQF